LLQEQGMMVVVKPIESTVTKKMRIQSE